MEALIDKFLGEVVPYIIEAALFAAGAGIQLIFCLFVKPKALKIIPAVVAKYAVLALEFAGIAVSVLGSGQDSLTMIMLGILCALFLVFPITVFFGTAVGWIIYAVIRSQRVKNQLPQV